MLVPNLFLQLGITILAALCLVTAMKLDSLADDMDEAVRQTAQQDERPNHGAPEATE
jgi:hypothetical protein